MNEDIKKSEILEDDLEKVSGGAERETSATCPMCGGKMKGTLAIPGNTDRIPKFICLSCRHAEW